jgi:hypothetical protein
MKVHLDGSGFRHQALFDQKCVPFDIIHVVVVFLLIQSKCQARPASAGGHVNPNRGYFLIGKVQIELLFCCFGKFKHDFLLEFSRAELINTQVGFVNPIISTEIHRQYRYPTMISFSLHTPQMPVEVG